MTNRQLLFHSRVLAVILVAVCASSVSWSQETARYEVSGGYSYMRAGSPGGESFNLQGANIAATYTFRQQFGFTADVGGYHFDDLGPGIDGRLYTVLLGPRFSYRHYKRFTPFAEALAGFARHSVSTGVNSAAENSFSMMLGGGLDITVRKRIAVRAAEVDYLLTRFEDASGSAMTQNSLRISTGVVLRFGKL